MDDQENKEEVQVKCTDYSLETRMAPRSRVHSPRVFILFYYFEDLYTATTKTRSAKIAQECGGSGRGGTLSNM